MTLHLLYPFSVLKQSLFVREAKLHGFPSPASITEGAKLGYIDHLKCKLASIQSHLSLLVRGTNT